MNQLIIESFGKVNLALDILYKRQDNYHEIRTIMQQIDLRDKLIFKETDEELIIESNHPKVPRNSDNLVYKAWEKMKTITGIKKGLYVKIEKNIPISAGLGGGSSNGAATLEALNKLWDLRFSPADLMDIGKDLGADIPFCIMGGTALGEGIGEKLSPLKAFSGKHILLCNPGIDISTAQVYGKIKPNGQRLDIEGLVEAIEKEDIKQVGKKLANKMETVVIDDYPVINEIKEAMKEKGAQGSLMSGSGSTVFGLFEDKEKMEKAYQVLKGRFDKVYMTRTVVKQ